MFVAWTKAFLEEASGSSEAVLPEMNMMVLAGFGGCTVARTASACAFQVRLRSARLPGDVGANCFPEGSIRRPI